MHTCLLPRVTLSAPLRLTRVTLSNSANWAALELRHDRVYSIWSKALLQVRRSALLVCTRLLSLEHGTATCHTPP